MSRIFISYRRSDSEGYVGRLYDHLIQQFDKNEIFLDVGTIKPGEDFVTVINQTVGSCDALIAVIGPRWLDVTDKHGNRRIDNPKDFVRLEIATALERNILVVPILIERASMPNAKGLPKDLKSLTRKNAIELSHDRFGYDVDRLVQAIGGAYGRIMVSFGSTYQSLVRTRLLNPQEGFEVFVDRKMVGKIERPGFSLKRETSDKKSWHPIVAKVKEGVHKISIKIHRSEFTSAMRSNELTFRIKGGQSIAFKVERESSTISGPKVILKAHKPIIDS
jgi:hypothetical protein